MSRFKKNSFSTSLFLGLRQPISCNTSQQVVDYSYVTGVSVNVAGAFYGILRIQSRSILISSSYADVSLVVSIDTRRDTP